MSNNSTGTPKCHFLTENPTLSCSDCQHQKTCPRLWTEERFLEWVTKNRSLLKYTTRSFVGKGIDFEEADVEQEALTSAYMASKKYDPSRGSFAKFETYACKAARQNLLAKIRDDGAKKRTTPDGRTVISADAPVSTDSEALSVYEVMRPWGWEPDIDDDLIAQDLKRWILRVADDDCTDKEKDILNLLLEYYDKGTYITQDKIGKVLKCSQAQISSIMQMLRAKLRIGLAEIGYHIEGDRYTEDII